MYLVEIIVTSTIIICAGTILYRSFSRKSKGQCDCGSCSSHCPKYKKKQ